MKNTPPMTGETPWVTWLMLPVWMVVVIVCVVSFQISLDAPPSNEGADPNPDQTWNPEFNHFATTSKGKNSEGLEPEEISSTP